MTQSRTDYVTMLANANLRLNYGLSSHYIYWSLYQRGFLAGLGDITLWEYWELIIEEVEWIQDTRF